MLKSALGKCRSEAERGESAIGVLRNALGMCKRGAREEEEKEDAGHTGASVKTRNYQCAIDSFLIFLNDLRGGSDNEDPT